MNKVHGKTIFYPKWAFHSKVMTRNLFFCKDWAASFYVGHKGKKTFLSQSVLPTFTKPFAHVLLVV
jgi:hypothetical protein